VLPFGSAELLDAVAGRARVLDLGCGSGRLTAALADAGHQATGIDTSERALAAAQERARPGVTLLHADMTGRLPFDDASLDAVVSRLSLMIPPDPAATLREAARCLVPGGVVATIVWASCDENTWFCVPRAAATEVVGAERARFARVFGRLGTPEALAGVHVDAGLADVQARRLHETLPQSNAEAHWRWLVETNGHFTRLDATLTGDERARILDRLAAQLGTGELALPRTLILATARATVPDR
jgi:SAM-dependent methyltransferase